MAAVAFDAACLALAARRRCDASMHASEAVSPAAPRVIRLNRARSLDDSLAARAEIDRRVQLETSANRARRATISSATSATRIPLAASDASSAGISKRYCAKHRAAIEHPVPRGVRHERRQMIVPIRSATTCLNTQLNAGTASARTSSCPSSTPTLNDSSDVSRCAPANCIDSRSANEKPKPWTSPKPNANIHRRSSRAPTMFSSAM